MVRRNTIAFILLTWALNCYGTLVYISYDQYIGDSVTNINRNFSNLLNGVDGYITNIWIRPSSSNYFVYRNRQIEGCVTNVGSETGAATGAEADPIWAAASNAYMTGASAAGLSNAVAANTTGIQNVGLVSTNAQTLATTANTNANGRLAIGGGTLIGPVTGTTFSVSSVNWTNAVTMSYGKLGGTNGVYWNRNGTNYWITFGTVD